MTKVISRNTKLKYLCLNSKNKKMKHVYLFVLLAIPFFGTSQTVEEINKPIISELDEVAPFSEGLAAVRKGNQWGFIDKEGHLAIDFRDDVLWNREKDDHLGVSGIGYPAFKDGLCFIHKPDAEGISLYGFMNTKGETVIQPEYVNITSFDNGYAVGIYANKTLRGKNEFKLNIYDYKFTEVLVNKQGEMVWPVQERQNIVMSKRHFKLPELHAKMLTGDLLAVKGKDNQWKVVQLELKDN